MNSLINPPFAFFYNIQGGQLFIIILAILILFGAKRMPDIAKSMGKAFNEFRNAASDIQQDINKPKAPQPAKELASTEASSQQATTEAKETVTS